MLHALAEKIRRNEPIPGPVAALLTAATPVVRLGMWLRLRQPCVRVPAYVISFGNITAGGTGKTPAVLERARTELAAGKKVAVLTRGYGTPQKTPLVVYDSTNTPGRLEPPYELLGDEPALIARNAPGVMIVKGVDRVAAARCAVDEYGCQVVILDDGFQHVRLARDENVLVIDATNAFGNGHLIPRGILREPIRAVRRATAIVLTRCDQARGVSALIARLNDLCPGVPVRTTRHLPAGLWRVADGAAFPVEDLRGKRVKAACAIANPEAFFKTLEDLGATVSEHVVLPDHCTIPVHVLTGSDWIVTTEKDAVRMSAALGNVLALRVELEDYTPSE